jgi:hypothetical protein
VHKRPFLLNIHSDLFKFQKSLTLGSNLKNQL